jgi:hypothetical protein
MVDLCKNDAEIIQKSQIAKKGRKNFTKSNNDAKHKTHKQCKTRTNQKGSKIVKKK